MLVKVGIIGFLDVFLEMDGDVTCSSYTLIPLFNSGERVVKQSRYRLVNVCTVKYGNAYSFGVGHILCACCLALKYLKPTKSLLFSAVAFSVVALVTIFVSADFMPGKALQPANRSLLPLIFGAFVSTVVWALAALPPPTPNATCAECLAYTTVRAVRVHSAPRPGEVARNDAELAGSNVFGVFFSSFMCLFLHYRLYKVGSLQQERELMVRLMISGMENEPIALTTDYPLTVSSVICVN